jgi:Lar family restriction alleviation protein
MEKLKPCPFCGSEDVSLSVGKNGIGESLRYVECVGCGAMADMKRTIEEAIGAWNKRK